MCPKNSTEKTSNISVSLGLKKAEAAVIYTYIYIYRVYIIIYITHTIVVFDKSTIVLFSAGKHKNCYLNMSFKYT